MTPEIEHLRRTEAPQVLGARVRRFGHFDIAEDAVQEALLAASRTWPADGVPDNPRSWLDQEPLTRQRDRAVRAHLLEMTGDTASAAARYREAAALTDNRVEQRYLHHRAHRLG